MASRADHYRQAKELLEEHDHWESSTDWMLAAAHVHALLACVSNRVYGEVCGAKGADHLVQRQQQEHRLPGHVEAVDCVCGAPETIGVVHRSDGPCYHQPLLSEQRSSTPRDSLAQRLAQYQAGESEDQS